MSLDPKSMSLRHCVRVPEPSGKPLCERVTPILKNKASSSFRFLNRFEY
jgi:hypothetical protein